VSSFCVVLLNVDFGSSLKIKQLNYTQNETKNKFDVKIMFEIVQNN